VQNETVRPAAYQYSRDVPRLSTSQHSQQTESQADFTQEF